LRTHSRRLLASTLLGLSAITATILVPAATFAATSVATPTAATAATCDEGRWPASVAGRPMSLKAGARTGDYIWHTSAGWHLRVTHPGRAGVIFSGRIVSNAALRVVPFKLESGDKFVLSADKKTLTYRFVNHGRIDGLDFTTACATRLMFRGSVAGTRLRPGRIWIGHAGRHPLQNPFVVLRNR
jgi:hypothetical protein